MVLVDGAELDSNWTSGIGDIVGEVYTLALVCIIAGSAERPFGGLSEASASSTCSSESC